MEIANTRKDFILNELLENFLKILEKMDTKTKVTVIARISESILKEPEKSDKEKVFYSCFGSWETDQSADELISMIYSARHFRERNIEL